MLFRQPFHGRQLTGKKQSGVAIITALLIVTIAVTISISISTQLQLDIRRTGNLIALDQSDVYVSLAEKIAQEFLQDQDDFNKLMDTLREEGKFQAPFNVDNGVILGEITDLNSCINLNTVIDSSVQPPVVDAIVQDRLERLLSNNNIPPTFVAALIDWIDTDSIDFIPGAGAEDGHYLNLEQAYHTANQPLSSITEARLIKGAEDLQQTPVYAPYSKILELAEAFRDYANNWPSLCAFDTSAGIPQINVNTASKDVLLALSTNMTTADVDAILECRGKDGDEFEEMNDFINCGGATSGIGSKITGPDRDQLVFTSDYFLLKTTVILGDIKKITYSIIFLDSNDSAQIISRTQRTL